MGRVLSPVLYHEVDNDENDARRRRNGKNEHHNRDNLGGSHAASRGDAGREG